MKSATLRPWKTISKETILKHNRFLSVEVHAVELPGGRVIPDWGWVIVPDAVIVLAQDCNGKFLSFRQTKYAIPGTTLAVVAGMLETGEDPQKAAKRELLEETGYQASEWVALGKYVCEPNRGVCTIHLFYAKGAVQVREPDADDLEDQELILLEREALEAAVLRGEYQAIMWTAAVAMALLHIDHSS